MKETELVTIPWNCPVCSTCRLIVQGSYGCAGPRQCVVGGPFKGYEDLSDKQYEGPRFPPTSGEDQKVGKGLLPLP